MATKWVDLPIVILVNIISYLGLTDRLTISAVCKRWRGFTLHPSFWLDSALKVNISSSRRPNFSKFCLSLVKEVELKLDSRNPLMLNNCVRVFDAISKNVSLESITISPTSYRLELPDRHKNHVEL